MALNSNAEEPNNTDYIHCIKEKVQMTIGEIETSICHQCSKGGFVMPLMKTNTL